MMATFTSVPENFVITKNGIVPKKILSSNDVFPTDNEINVCREWISKFTEHQKGINNGAWSYHLKHRVEEWANHYVSNGDFIQAALLEGYKCSKHTNGDTRDACFNMRVLPEDEWKRVKPIGFSKWLFKQRDSHALLAGFADEAFEDPLWPRKSETFFDFWIYLKSKSYEVAWENKLIQTLLDAWKGYSGKDAPLPDDEDFFLCKYFYSGECDVVRYGMDYKKADKGRTYIYVLFEPDLQTRKVVYVGQTNNPSERLQQHVLFPGSIGKVKWVGGILNSDKYPAMGIIDEVEKGEASFWEQVFVNAFAYLERIGNQQLRDILLNKKLT